MGKLADEVPGLSLTSGCGVGPTVCVSISASYALSNFVTMIDLARASVLRLDLRPPAPIFLPPFVLHMLNACRP